MPKLSKTAAARRTRIATICVLGRKATRVNENMHRGALLQGVVQHIRAQPDWHPIDALLLPGGYFRLGPSIGHLNHQCRIDAMGEGTFHRMVMAACGALEPGSPGALVVAGVDSHAPSKHDAGDHLCVAWSASGIVGIGRKVFPADDDTNVTKRPFVCYAADFGARQRYARLPNGRTATLGACYDLFGVSETVRHPSARTWYIRFVHDGTAVRSTDDPGFAALRRRLIAEWCRTLLDQAPGVALAAIHRFRRPGRDLYWQRHGIAQTSAALGGGLAIGAAHFLERLPSGRQSPLAAVGVPPAHLRAGQHRRAHPLYSRYAAEVSVGRLRCALRIYDSFGHERR